MMGRVTRFLCVLLTAAGVAAAQPFNMNTGDGEVSVWRLAAGKKEQVRGASTIGAGDTLFAEAADKDVVIQLEANSKILVKGGSTLVLAGEDGAVDAVLDDGQIFLDRGQPHELKSVRISAGGYSFVPAGTAAAVKIARGGAPTVAVLRGSVEMRSAEGGESVSVGPGQFGTVGGSGQMATGTLNDRGLQQLEAWTGVKAAAGAAQAAQAEPEEGAAAAAAVVPVPAGGPATAGDSPQSTEAAEAAQEEPAAVAEADTAAEAADDAADGSDDAAAGEALPEQPKKQKPPAEPVPIFSRPTFELSAGAATIRKDGQNEVMPYLLLGVDVPIWKFGIYLDFELFFETDPKFKASDKGWDFQNNKAETIYRKIRYIRYGREDDPVFVKIGGLESITLGYGIVMNRFTNMLNYPDQKLLGMQAKLNDLSPVGLSLHAMISDFQALGEDAGIVAARAEICPFKPTEISILEGLALGGTYAEDINTSSVFGFDIGLPLLEGEHLAFTLYSQYAGRADDVRGWGTGAPGLLARLWKLQGCVEYRMVEGRFRPSFYDRYYLLNQEYLRELSSLGVEIEEPSVSLSGVYGSAEMDLWGLLTLGAAYQYMTGSVADVTGQKIQDYEATVGLGETVLSLIPTSVNLAEVYANNSNVGLFGNYKFDKDDDWRQTDKLAGLFDRTPYMYYGYRVGFGLGRGASIVFDYRHGWIRDWNKEGKLISNDHLLVYTAMRF